MVKLSGIQLINTISLCIYAHLIGNVWSDDCRTSCGIILPTTVLEPNKSCEAVGETAVFFPVTINWDDGSYTVFNLTTVTQSVIGSCCSQFEGSYYGTGIVTSGRFTGQNVIYVYTLRNNRQTCDGCQSSVGLSRATWQVLLSIGTKGVANNWIECAGNGTALFSPPITSTPQNVYRTYYADLGECSDCVESC